MSEKKEDVEKGKSDSRTSSVRIVRNMRVPMPRI